jgi:hypothetical protein
MPNSFAVTPEGVLLVASGFDKVLRWDGLRPQAESAGVAAPTLAPTLAAAGTGAAASAVTGTYAVYLRYVDRNGNFSNLSPVSNEVTAAGADRLTYGNLQTPSDPKVVRRQVLRNTDGQAETYYVDVDTTDLTSAALSSSRSDADLQAQAAQALLTDDGLPLANARDQPPDTKAFVAHHLDRMYLGGEVEYAEGNVLATFGSTAVTGIGTEWTEVLPGRFLFVVGADRAYEIAAADPARQTLTLREPYQGATQPYASYAIRPEPAARRTVQFSEAGEPESWPPTNGFALAEDGDVITGLMPKASFLYVLERRNVWRFTSQTDPTKDGFVFHSGSRGCVNNRCWVVIDEAAFMLDEIGVHKFTGGEDTESLSDPIRDFFDGTGARWRINWAAARHFHAVHNPGEDCIRWFVALSGEYLPRHALCLQHGESRWWVEEYPAPVGASCLGRMNGRPQVFLGSAAARVLALGAGRLDGAAPDAGTTRGAVTSAGPVSLADSAASFAAGLAGAPVVIVSGRGKAQLRLVASNTATTLTLTQPWLVLPDATSTYQVGGVPWTYRTGWLRFASDNERDTPRRVEVLFDPTPHAGSFDVRFRRDRRQAYAAWDADKTSEEGDGVSSRRGDADLVCDLARDGGLVQQRLDHHKEWYANGPRFAQWELRGVGGRDRVRFFQVLLDGHMSPSPQGGD